MELEQKSELKAKIYAINSKGYANDQDIKTIWEVHDIMFSEFKGNKNCQECLREAVRKILIELEK